MTAATSSIKEFYPLNYPIDFNDNREEHLAVHQLPFIEKEKLLKATEKVQSTLNEKEKERNLEGIDIIYK